MKIRISDMTPEAWAAGIVWLEQKIGYTPDPCLFPHTGLMAVSETGRLLAVLYVFLEASGHVAVCGWLHASPGNTPRESHDAVSLLADYVTPYAKRHGVSWIMSYFGNRGLNAIFKRSGFRHAENAECLKLKVEE